MEMDKDQVINVVKYLNKHGIQLSAIYEPIGCVFSPGAADVPKMIDDRDAFFASECAISKEDYLEWKDFMDKGCLCKAKGANCQQKVTNYESINPQNYAKRKRENDLLCSDHTK